MPRPPAPRRPSLPFAPRRADPRRKLRLRVQRRPRRAATGARAAGDRPPRRRGEADTRLAGGASRTPGQRREPRAEPHSPLVRAGAARPRARGDMSAPWPPVMSSLRREVRARPCRAPRAGSRVPRPLRGAWAGAGGPPALPGGRTPPAPWETRGPPASAPQQAAGSRVSPFPAAARPAWGGGRRHLRPPASPGDSGHRPAQADLVPTTPAGAWGPQHRVPPPCLQTEHPQQALAGLGSL